MGMKEYISETEASHLSGVSVKTLDRFAETGYLSIERDADGIRLFSIEELKQVFGLADKVTPWEVSKKLKPIDTAKTKDLLPKDNHKEADTSYYTANSTNNQSPNLEQQQVNKNKKRIWDKGSAAYATPINDSSSSQPVSAAASFTDTSLLQEISRLERINDVNEKIIELREEQLRQTQEERDWLRRRVEQLEEKGDRDQILLLSETQLFRQLLEQQLNRKSPVRAALEWLGFVEAPTKSLQIGSSLRDKPKGVVESDIVKGDR
jgi:DNA-binding transcriptional MerR regulator